METCCRYVGSELLALHVAVEAVMKLGCVELLPHAVLECADVLDEPLRVHLAHSDSGVSKNLGYVKA